VPVKRRIEKARRDDYPKPWEERPVSLERWERHRDLMMARAVAGRRPEEWWEYEAPIPRPRDSEDEAPVLYEAGLLSAAEIAELMPRWREHYDKANKPDFCFCIGHAKPGDTFASWLEGAAARRAHYRWSGIPREIIKKWDAERVRRARAIRKLKRASAEADRGKA
jgi:hypothetical protein